MDIFAYLPELFSGISITILLMLMSIGIGLILAITMTIGIIYGNVVIQQFIKCIIFFIRGTPLLVQIFLIYYGSGQFEWIKDSWLWFVLSEPMTCAIIAFSISTACYTSVILQGAIHSVPRSEVDACDALGMSKWLAMRRVIFPRAFRIALPAYSNEVLIILKATSLASTITLLDVMGITQQLISQTYDTVFWYTIAAVIYLILNSVIIAIFKTIKMWSTLPSHG